MNPITRFNPLLDAGECVGGYLMWPARDQYIGPSLSTYGEYCRGELRAVLPFLKPGSVVIEVGSNIGAHTIPLAKKIAPHGKIVAFEPQPFLANILRTNALLNGLENVVTVVESAVGDENKTVRFPSLSYAVTNNFGGLEVLPDNAPFDGPTFSVNMVRLDHFFLNNKPPRVDLLKIDAEASSFDILNNSRTIIHTYRPVIIIEDDRKDQKWRIERFLDDLPGYSLTRVDCPLYPGRRNFNRSSTVLFENIFAFNLMAVPKERM